MKTTKKRSSRRIRRRIKIRRKRRRKMKRHFDSGKRGEGEEREGLKGGGKRGG